MGQRLLNSRVSLTLVGRGCAERISAMMLETFGVSLVSICGDDVLANPVTKRQGAVTQAVGVWVLEAMCKDILLQSCNSETIVN